MSILALNGPVAYVRQYVVQLFHFRANFFDSVGTATGLSKSHKPCQPFQLGE